MDEKAPMTVEQAVQIGADTFARWEEQIAVMKDEARGDMRNVFKTVRNNQHIGGLECEALSSEIDALVTQFEADVFAIHAELTERAKKAGIDLPQRSGGR